MRRTLEELDRARDFQYSVGDAPGVGLRLDLALAHFQYSVGDARVVRDYGTVMRLITLSILRWRCRSSQEPGRTR